MRIIPKTVSIDVADRQNMADVAVHPSDPHTLIGILDAHLRQSDSYRCTRDIPELDLEAGDTYFTHKVHFPDRHLPLVRDGTLVPHPRW